MTTAGGKPRSGARPGGPLLLPILIAISAIGPLALNIFIPSMPGLVAVFATDYATVQLTLTLYLVAVALAQLLLGPLSDRYGRRPVLLVGLTLFSVGGLLAATATAIETLIVGRMVQAVGGSAGLVLGRAVIRDLYEQDAAASMIAYVTMAMVVAPMIAPALGGFLEDGFGWQASFVLLIAAGAMVLALVAWRLPETHLARGASFGLSGLLRDFSRLLCCADFNVYALALGASSAVFFAFLAGAPYAMVKIMHRTPSEYGLYFIMVSLGYMGGNFFTARCSRRLGGALLIYLGALIAVLGTLALAALSYAGGLHPVSLFGAMSVVAVGNGMLIPSATAAVLGAVPGLTGAASGLSGSLQIATGALATWLVGWLQDDSERPMVMIMLGAALLSALAVGVGGALRRR